jgi:UPF0755 protein
MSVSDRAKGDFYLMSFAFRLLRNLMIPLILAAVLIALVFGVFIVWAAANAPNPSLNPLESFALRIRLALNSQTLDQSANGPQQQIICFTVNQGDSAATIVAALNARGFNINADLFRAYVRFQGIDAKLQAGVFQLSTTFTIPQIAFALTNATTQSINFRVIEGWRIEEIAQAIDRSALPFSGADFLGLVSAGRVPSDGPIAAFALRAGIPAGRSLEGFLFPDTYQLPVCGTAFDLVKRMTDNFDVRVTDKMRTDSQTVTGLTLYQAITLASIVQREAALSEESPRIAGVYVNRYRNAFSGSPNPSNPITLDADPTIQYALGTSRDPNTWWPQLTRDDYQGVNSPYNTYRNRGLPPSPIANPGLAAIQAAIYPEVHSFYFFRTCPGDGGRHRFNQTFAEHNVACPVIN